MKMIKPIVNLSKIAENYDTFLIGFNGVLTEGAGLLPDAVKAVNNLLQGGKNVILLSNTAQRVASLAADLRHNGINPALLSCMMTVGEILHYQLKYRNGDFAAIGNNYYQLGAKTDKGIFYGLDYQFVPNIETAHFIYMDEVASAADTLEKYLPELEHAVSLGLPFVCTGNDTSCFKDGKIGLAPAALAEQYAVMGGRIITLGKPETRIFSYCLSALENPGAVLVIGDNLATDIKGAELLNLDAMLLSKGVHVNYLGEGYIPDVAKTRELANNFDVSPQYVMSNLRW